MPAQTVDVDLYDTVPASLPTGVPDPLGIERKGNVVSVTPDMGLAVPAQPAAPAAPRPAWLPEKFKSPEDMARSYAELEARLGGKPAPAAAAAPTTPATASGSPAAAPGTTAAPATPISKQNVDTSPSLAPSTAARSQPTCWLLWISWWRGGIARDRTARAAPARPITRAAAPSAERADPRPAAVVLEHVQRALGQLAPRLVGERLARGPRGAALLRRDDGPAGLAAVPVAG